ncbi:MAG TPA: ChbG/HpnK family deacetylase [Candidatus Acidoferrales bacterium]|nr:ChbG/HpnK family deacetylase [Candidatus Acidoferrales bacterium]
MKRLIVNADDFGWSEGVSRGIAEAHREGIVTSTTLLANGAAFEAAVRLARQEPRLGVGVHLNLSDGRPILAGWDVPSLVNAQGQFSGGPMRLAAKMFAGRLQAAEVEAEWDAQISKVRKAGIQPTHLDGHKHVQMLPALFPIALRLAKRHGIAAVRVSVEHFIGWNGVRRNRRDLPAILKQRAQARALNWMATDARDQVRRAGLACADFFCGLTQTGFLGAEEIEAILWNLPEGTTELMCHPGYHDAALAASATRLQMHRERELEGLKDVQLRKVIAAVGAELIHYGRISEGE